MFGIELQPIDFVFSEGFLRWLANLGITSGVMLLVALVTSLAMHGMVGPARLVGGLKRALTDFAGTSPRRVLAIADLTFKEAVRRKALLVFVIFAVLFMFGSWFIAGDSNRPELDVEVYVSFVFTAITWLVGLMALLLSCWGIPEDIRLRSLHTVVTKPVRRGEVVMGRMLGFVAVNSIVVVVMGIVGYFWIVRSVPDTVDLTCRVPIYGDLEIFDRSGQPGGGVNVGDIVETRKFIEGGTKSTGVWKFPIPGRQPELLRFESRFEAFRTFKGDMNRSLRVRYVLVNDAKKLRVPLPEFNVSEFGKNELDVERSLKVKDEKTLKETPVDLYADLVADGKLTVHVQCLDRNQYIGVSKGDFFVRELPDRSFAAGYFKAMVGVWLTIVLVVMFGVALSCLVKGPVATLACVCVLVLGQQKPQEFMDGLITGKQHGGGAFESIYRLVTQMNQTVPLPDDGLSATIKVADYVPFTAMWIARKLFPDMQTFSMSAWVGKGLDVPWAGALLPSLAVTLAYLLPCILVGYFCLSMRELEAK